MLIWMPAMINNYGNERVRPAQQANDTKQDYKVGQNSLLEKNHYTALTMQCESIMGPQTRSHIYDIV